jgi:predicted DNA-binding protein with PD1-like motif
MFGIEGCALTRRRFLAAAGLGVAAGLPAAGRAAAGDEARPPRQVLVSDQNNTKTYVLAFDKGQEVMASLLAFAKKQPLTAGGLTGIGAVSGAVLAFFDRKAREYKHIPVGEQAEVASLIGNVSLVDGEPFLHVHAVLGLPDGSARVGHVLEAHVWPTLEVVLTTWTQGVRRDRDKETCLELLRP